MWKWANIFSSPQRARGRARPPSLKKHKTTGRHQHRGGQLGTFMSLPTISKMETIMSRHRHRGGQLAGNLRANPQDPQSGRAIIGRRESRQVDSQTTDPQNHMSTIGRTDQSQKPHVTKNHKTTHTRTTKDPQRPKTRKVACRAGLTSIRHAKTTKTTKTTEPCGSSHACGYLGGYSPYFYIILYIYKSECE